MKILKLAPIFLVGALMISSSIRAQNEVDALRHSSILYSGTARYMAMGGSFGALGGDVSVISTNPAGIGFFRSGEMTISPTILSSKTTSEYYGSNAEESGVNFNISNFGYVTSKELDKGKWKFFQLGFGFNRLKDLHEDIRIKGRHDDSSLLDPIADSAYGIESDAFEDGDPFFIYPAYQTFLIDPNTQTSDLDYISAIPAGTEVEQESFLESRGRISEMVIVAAANYDDFLYIGAGLGFQGIVRDEFTEYSEVVIDTANTNLEEFGYYQDSQYRGNGFNLKFGVIFRPNDLIRIGGSYITPTWSTTTIDWFTQFDSRFDDGTTYSELSPVDGRFRYNLTSPGRLMGSLGLVIAKQGLFNIEYEFVDHSASSLNEARNYDAEFFEANSQIRAQYRTVGNIRMGAEYRYNRYSLRGGLGIYPSPYDSSVVESDSDNMVYSAGLGYRKNRLFFDFAFRLKDSDGDYYPYSPDYVNPSTWEGKERSYVMTLGFKF